MKPVKIQNLPQNKVCAVAISEDATAQIIALHKLGISTISVPRCDLLQKGVSSHADMLLFHKGSNRVLLHDYSEKINRSLLKLGFEVELTKTPPKAEYPHDIALNSFLLGGYFVGSHKFSKEVAFSDAEYECIDVKQGYAKCSSIVLNENAVITSDKGIHKALSSRGVDCIYVTTKGIVLNGYDCGFIGGTCGKIDKDVLAFTGRLKVYPDGENIINFCKKHGIKVHILCDAPLTDVGSILPLCEKE